MAATLHPSPVPTPSSSSPPTPPYPAFPRLPSGSGGPSVSRNASSSSSKSNTTTSSSSSSLVAVPIRPPPLETRTAATTPQQIPSRPASTDPEIVSPSLRGGRYTSPRLGAGRGIYRGGARSRQHPDTPPIVTSSKTRSSNDSSRPSTAPTELSPTTPRGPRSKRTDGDEDEPVPSPIRVTISMDNTDSGPSSPMPQHYRGRGGMRSIPSSPISHRDESMFRGKARTLSADREMTRDRERRQSQISSHSASSGHKKPSLKDFVLGEELGRGSYSTVFSATSATNQSSPTSNKPREYAIKVINQAHLIAEKKAKYAMIERDALIRLGTAQVGNRGHRRGMSSSSSGGFGKRKSNTSMAGTTSTRRDGVAVPTPNTPGGANRLSVDTASMSSVGSTSSVSPTFKGSSFAGRRPSRSAEPPEMVPERSEENISESPVEALRSTAPSPVEEETPVQTRPPRRSTEETESPMSAVTLQSPETNAHGRQRKRRQSLAPSERSTKSAGRGGQVHPGVIRLHSTFNDMMSLYFVLDLAKNGEMLGYIRKHGSFDVESTRYYAALLIDTIEFMHERGVIHRDLKPENILMDEEMRTKVTDFGSAKIMSDTETAQPEDERKRSFVGSADFVSPEVLRNEPAVAASDVWAFGCIVYQFLVGKPPFRGATDYLTFQKILKREMEMPDELDGQAKDLVNTILNLDPAARPTPAEIKTHPFFSSIDFATVWTMPAVPMSTGITPPAQTGAQPTESDIWAVFDEDASDGGFDFDLNEEEETMLPEDGAGLRRTISTAERAHRASPHFDHKAAAKAVMSVDDPSLSATATGSGGRRGRHSSGGSLEPPRFAWADAPWRRKKRGLSAGSRSARTSSSSSANRTALTGLLETMGISSLGTSSGATSAVSGSGSGVLPSIATAATSKASTGSKEDATGGGGVTQTEGGIAGPEPEEQTGGEGTQVKQATGQLPQSSPAPERWVSLLSENERVIESDTFLARPLASTSASLIPAFLLPAFKKRILVLTNKPRLVEIKDDMAGPGPRVKFEAAFGSPSETSTPAPAPAAPVSVVTGRGSSRPGTSDGTDKATTRNRDDSPAPTGSGSATASTPAAGSASSGVAVQYTDVIAKGSKGFVINTTGNSVLYVCESPATRDRWIQTIKEVSATAIATRGGQ